MHEPHILSTLRMRTFALVGNDEENGSDDVERGGLMGQGPYPQYTESGIDFIGQVPSHWETKKLKFIVSKVG